MEFSGILKLSLLDYPGKIASTLFLSGCNFKCGFCHNSDLVFNKVEKKFSLDYVLSYLKGRKNILEGVCITGGEPTLYDDLPDFIKEVKDLGLSVKLDTNGTNFKMLKYLAEQKLIDYVAMDIKTSKDRYSEAAGCAVDIGQIESSVQFLLNGNLDYEFRTTCVKEYISEADFLQIAKWIKGAKRFFLQAFTDNGTNICQNLTGFEPQELQKIKNIFVNYVSEVSIRGT